MTKIWLIIAGALATVTAAVAVGVVVSNNRGTATPPTTVYEETTAEAQSTTELTTIEETEIAELTEERARELADCVVYNNFVDIYFRYKGVNRSTDIIDDNTGMCFTSYEGINSFEDLEAQYSKDFSSDLAHKLAQEQKQRDVMEKDGTIYFMESAVGLAEVSEITCEKNDNGEYTIISYSEDFSDGKFELNTFTVIYENGNYVVSNFEYGN